MNLVFNNIVLLLTGKHVFLVGMEHHTTHPPGLQVAQSSTNCCLSPFRWVESHCHRPQTFKVLCVVFMGNGKMEPEMDRQVAEELVIW